MRMMILTLLLLICSVLFLATLPGCNEAEVAQFKLSLAQAEADMAQVAQDVATLPDGPEKAKAQELLNLVSARVASLNAQLETIEDTPGLIMATSREIGTVVPPPFGSWIALLGVGLAGIWRSVRARTAARNIAASVDKVLTKEQRAKITGQSALARKIVDEAQSKTPIFPL